MTASAPNVDVLIQGVKGGEVPDSDFISYIVDRDMYQPDSATIVLSNQNDIYTSVLKLGATVEIKVGDDSTSIYKGEVTGIEPIHKAGDVTKIVVRSFNKLHRLLRMRKSVTFVNKTDQQIIQQVAGDAGLALEWKHEKSITYKHVYQHNLTDLEFIRMRAARMGCHVWCVDQKLFVKEPELDKVSDIKLNVDKSGKLRVFTPRVSSAAIVKKVTVKGWNPETKELITGEAQAQDSKLGKDNAVTACGDLGKEETFTVDQPIWEKEEADALAKARLRDLNLTFITGEAEIAGDPKVELGSVVQITANENDKQDNFNGNYYVMGVTHRHTMPKAKEGGFVTILKLARDAWKPRG